MVSARISLMVNGDGTVDTPERVRAEIAGRSTTTGSRYVRIVGMALALSGVLYAVLGLTPEVWGDVQFGTRADDAHWRLSMASGTVALLLLSIALVIGPLGVLRGRRPRTHLATRRAVGLAAATLSAIHVGFGATIHSVDWKVWVPFGYPWTRVGFHPRILGVSFWIGLGALVLVALLAATSTDGWMRRLGPGRWKLVQRAAYPLYALVALHVVTIQLQENRSWGHAGATLAVVVATIVMQIAGVAAVRRVGR